MSMEETHPVRQGVQRFLGLPCTPSTNESDVLGEPLWTDRYAGKDVSRLIPMEGVVAALLLGNAAQQDVALCNSQFRSLAPPNSWAELDVGIQVTQSLGGCLRWTYVSRSTSLRARHTSLSQYEFDMTDDVFLEEDLEAELNSLSNDLHLPAPPAAHGKHRCSIHQFPHYTTNRQYLDTALLHLAHPGSHRKLPETATCILAFYGALCPKREPASSASWCRSVLRSLIQGGQKDVFVAAWGRLSQALSCEYQLIEASLAAADVFFINQLYRWEPSKVSRHVNAPQLSLHSSALHKVASKCTSEPIAAFVLKLMSLNPSELFAAMKHAASYNNKEMAQMLHHKLELVGGYQGYGVGKPLDFNALQSAVEDEELAELEALMTM